METHIAGKLLLINARWVKNLHKLLDLQLHSGLLFKFIGEPRVTLQSRESSFESHFPLLGAKFNFLNKNAIWETGNEK